MSETIETGVVPVTLDAAILKADNEQRIVYGWASVYAENGTPASVQPRNRKTDLSIRARWPSAVAALPFCTNTSCRPSPRS
ncbi:MAG: hypothetical protein JNK95_12270 [Candidatus Competibacter sp.]|nr:hypothetical protein [Candidatus Competibacter sp.]MDG4606518.1 hypothetical protein [Candidatus Contendobacter sp.]HRD47981.1 hypothetical protein [Candidatus Contendobacter sp.]